MSQKKKMKLRVGSLIKTVVLLAASVYLLIPVTEALRETFRLKKELTEVTETLVSLEAQNELLNEQKDKLLDPEYVKSYARANYMLTKEGEQIYYLPENDE